MARYLGIYHIRSDHITCVRKVDIDSCFHFHFVPSTQTYTRICLPHLFKRFTESQPPVTPLQSSLFNPILIPCETVTTTGLLKHISSQLNLISTPIIIRQPIILPLLPLSRCPRSTRSLLTTRCRRRRPRWHISLILMQCTTTRLQSRRRLRCRRRHLATGTLIPSMRS